MNQNFELLGYCCLFCGSCNHYRSSFQDGKHLLEEAISKGIDPNNFTCKGCRGDIEFIHPGCDICDIKQCAENKGLIHCGLCKMFPCEMLLEFQNDERYIHHLDIIANLKELKEKGPIHWLKEQEQKWKCECGKPFSWYEVKCTKCGSKLISYGNELKRNKK